MRPGRAAGDAGQPVAGRPQVRRGEGGEGQLQVGQGSPLGPPDPPAPDFGGPGLHPTAGATAVGAREVLVAYNVELAGADLELARRIASAVRERDGGLPAVRAMGVALPGRGLVQVSMNLLDYRATPPAVAFAAVAGLAERAGARVEASEIVGLVPAAALDGTDPADLRLRGFTPDKLLETRLLQALTTSKELR